MVEKSVRTLCHPLAMGLSNVTLVGQPMAHEKHLLGLASRSAMANEARAWNARMVSVPPRLHQSWKNCTLPFQQRAWHQRCDTILPLNWSMWLWTDEDNREFIAREFPSFLALYDGYDVHIKRIDAVRYFYIYRYGGVYMDLDMLCLRPFEPVLLPGYATFGTVLKFHKRRGQTQTREQCEAGHCLRRSGENVHPALMAAPPRHPFFAFLIHRLHSRANASFRGKRAHPLAATGPAFLSDAIMDWAKLGYGSIMIRENPTFFNGGPTKPPFVGCNTMEAIDSNTPAKLEKFPKTCAIRLPNSTTTSFWTGVWISDWIAERNRSRPVSGQSVHQDTDTAMKMLPPQAGVPLAGAQESSLRLSTPVLAAGGSIAQPTFQTAWRAHPTSS